jgi:hypothetical protein
MDSNQAREKVNLYLSSEVIEKVEDTLFLLRKQLPREKRKKLTRSKLHELILDDILTEFSKMGQSGRLGKIISEWNES